MDFGLFGFDVGQCVNKYGKCLIIGECCCWGQYGVEVGIVGGGDGLGGGVVVGQKICFVYIQMGLSFFVCEVEYLECDCYLIDVVMDFEWIDFVIDEVVE